jgi:hypothetical protein
VLSFFWCLEVSGQQIKLSRADYNLGHAESDSKLCVGDEASPQLVKVSKELVNANASLLADSTDSSDHIVKVLRTVSNNIGFANSRLGLWEVVKRVVEISADTVKTF